MAFYKYFWILLCIPFSLAGQGGFIIGPGANVVIKNNPKIIIRDGKFKNDGNFVAGKSTVILTGTTATEHATIGGMAITPFHHLMIAKSSNDVRLDFDIEVNGDLTMKGGLLILNYSDIELGGDILGENEGTRITGTDGGAIIKTVPLNSPLAENPGNLGAEFTSNENFGMTYIRRTHVQQQNGSNYGIFRNYDISTDNNPLDAELRFHYFDAELGGLTENDLEIWHFDNGSWSSLGMESINTAKNWVAVSGINSLNTVTLAVDLSDVLLPVELLSFEATANENKTVDLFWATASEINNDFFTVERSRDGIQFEFVTQIDGTGNATEVNHYQAVDPAPYSGISYYRLRQTDLDGAFSFSEIKAVEITQDPQALSVYPNPMENVLHIAGQLLPEEKTIIRILDASGKLVYQRILEPGPQSKHFEIKEVSGFPAGAYFLHVKSNRENHYFNLMKINR